MWKKLLELIKKNKKTLVKYLCSCILFCCAIGLMISSYNYNQTASIEKISYTEFLELVEEGAVDTVYYSGSEEWMTVTLYNDETRDMSDEELEYYVYKNEDKRRVLYPAYDEFRKDMLDADVKLSIVTSSASVVSIIASLITSIVPIMFLIYIFRMVATTQKGMNKEDLLQTSNVKFDNVIGQEEILEDVQFITKLLKNPDIGKEVGTQLPKGILLAGEPGTGKTLIAKAIAGEAGVPFIYVNSSSLIEMFVGMGAKRVRDIFKVARQNAPCVVFFDEIDAIGCSRNHARGTSENDQTINALLQEMDGFTGREGIFIIAATNRADILDTALVRAGRFDRQINVTKPRDWKVRVDLFKFYLNKYSVSDDVDIENLAKQVSGFTGADIAAVVNEASIIAVIKEKSCIDMDCIEEAIDKKIFKGNRTKEDHFLDDKKVVAYHESGHAVMTYLCKLPISRASIIGTTSGVGGVVFGADSDSSFLTDKELRNRILVAYAGRASEQIKFNSLTNGAQNDITQATQMLVTYLEKFGFDKDFGLLDMEVIENKGLIEATSLTTKLQSMSKELYADAVKILKQHYNLVEILAQKLLQVETLSGNEIEELFKEATECSTED